MIHRAFTTLALLSALPMAAQTTGLTATLGLVRPQGDASYMTQKTFGYALEAGYRMAPPLLDGAELRPYAGIVQVKGNAGFQGWHTDTEQRYSYDMRATIYGLDVLFPFTAGGQSLHAITGPSIHHWYVTRVQGGIAQGNTRARAGWRAGLGWDIKPNLTATVLYTVSEWRTKAPDTLVYEPGANPSRPAYLTMAATWRF